MPRTQERACPLPAARRQGASTTPHSPIRQSRRTGDAAKRRHAAPPCNGRNLTHAYCARQPRRAPPSQPRQTARCRTREATRSPHTPMEPKSSPSKKPASTKSTDTCASRSPFTNLPDEATVYKAKKPIGTIEKKSAKGAPSTSPKRSEKPNATAEEEQAHKQLRAQCQKRRRLRDGDVGWRIGSRNLSKHGLKQRRAQAIKPLEALRKKPASQRLRAKARPHRQTRNCQEKPG